MVNQTTDPKLREDKNYYDRKVYPNHANITYRNAKCTAERERNCRIGNPDHYEAFYNNGDKDRNSMSLRLLMLEKNLIQ